MAAPLSHLITDRRIKPLCPEKSLSQGRNEKAWPTVCLDMNPIKSRSLRVRLLSHSGISGHALKFQFVHFRMKVSETQNFQWNSNIIPSLLKLSRNLAHQVHEQTVPFQKCSLTKFWAVAKNRKPDLRSVLCATQRCQLQTREIKLPWLTSTPEYLFL